MNLYDVLGIDRNATQNRIKKAHRNLVKQLHPDIGGDPIRFAEVQAAYEILMNEELREEYDRTGIIPKRAANNLSAQAHQLFLQLFIGVVQNIAKSGQDPEQFDLVNMIEQKANAIIANEIESGINSSKHTNEILNKMINRFKSKEKGKEPFSHAILRSAITNNENHIRQLEEQRRVINHLIVLLDDLVFEAKTRTTTVVFSGSSTTYGTSYTRSW